MCSRCSICRLFFCDIFRDFLPKLKIRKSPANKDVRAQLLSHSFLIPWCARLSPRHPAKMCHKESLWLRLCRFARRKKNKICLCHSSLHNFFASHIFCHCASTVFSFISSSCLFSFNNRFCSFSFFYFSDSMRWGQTWECWVGMGNAMVSVSWVFFLFHKRFQIRS